MSDLLTVDLCNVTYSIVPSRLCCRKGKPLEILRGVSTRIRAGKLTAILGSSGAGKTTLLHCLAGLCSCEGIFINGIPVEPKVLRKITGLLHQEDVVLPIATVEELLQMAVALRRQNPEPKMAEGMLSTLSLKHARRTVVGDSMSKGVSGGERKRCCIGQELIADPMLLLLDECTSGLDAYSALSVIQLLKEAAKSGKTVVATLHQPSSEVFHAIDDIIILQNGVVVYSGPANEMVAHFTKLGFHFEPYFNPADYLFVHILSKPQNVQPFTLVINDLTTATGSDLKIFYTYFPSFRRQLQYLVPRNFIYSWRHPLMFRMRIINAIFQSTLMGFMFFNIANSEPAGGIPFSLIGSFFFTTILLFLENSVVAMGLFLSQRAVLCREIQSRYFGVLAYFCAKLIAEIPALIIAPLIFSVIAEYLIGYNLSNMKYFWYILNNTLQTATGMSLGILLACSFDSIDSALAVLPAVSIPMILLGGFLAVDAREELSWIQWFSPIQYSFTAHCQNFFDDYNHKYDNFEIKGPLVLNFLKMNQKPYLSSNFIFLFLLFAAYTVAAYFSLKGVINKYKN